MGRVLSQLRIENYHTKELIYSKLVRGGLSFIVELHELDKGRKFQIYLYRDHPRIKEFLAAGIEKELFTTQPSECKLNAGTIRLGINDTNFMLNTNGDTEIKIQEYNFSSKKYNFQDFAKGKVAILIELALGGETDNSKVKSELKSYFTEEQKWNNK